MSSQIKIDRILEAIESRVQDEVGSLLGVDFLLADAGRKPVTKEEAFAGFLGKQICSKMDIVGDVEGNGGLFLGVKDAIRLGGTLIMLPTTELEEVIGREEYNEEIEDSFGEIANIIAGSYTKDFEELFSKSCRFVRKELEVVVPGKVDIESDKPVEDIIYYQVSSSMVLDGVPMGDMVMLIPAEPFELVWEGVGPKAKETEKGVAEKEETQAVDSDGKRTPVEGAAAPESSGTADLPPGFNVEKHKERVDRLLGICQEKLGSEIGSLLGAEVDLSGLLTQLVTKEEFFLEHTAGKQIIADMDVVGDLEDRSFFAVGLKDAIHLGGLLIMLPPAELETIVAEEDFSEDSEDAYGEIANIASGVYTSVFEEQYSKSLRFIRKSLQQVVPMKVDAESDEPIPNKTYYMSSMDLNINGTPLGKVQMLFPADMLQLSTLGQEIEEQAVAQDAAPPAEAETSGKSAQQVAPVPPGFDVERHQQRVDKLLETCKTKMAGEVGALLGVDILLDDLNNRLVGKEDFFLEEVAGKQIIADMDVVGDMEDKSYLCVGLKDAIRIGGTLIMLPDSELQSTVDNDEFGEDIEDSYGEIANIISGVYTSVFEEGYTKQIRFIKTALQQVIPMKVDTAAEEPIPDQQYYVSSMSLTLAGTELGHIHFLFPANLLQLGTLGQEEEILVGSAAQNKQAGSGDLEGAVQQGVSTVAGESSKPIDVLLIGDDEAEANKLKAVLEGKGCTVRLLSFKDNVHNFLPGKLKAVFLVTREVDEQAFGVAIKVSTACSLPLIAAAPGWTKTKVIKAVKYGVRDILLTPASTEEIEQNIDNNIMKLAA